MEINHQVDREVSKLIYLGSTKIQIDSIMGKTLMQKASNYQGIEASYMYQPTEYECIQNVLYDHRRFKWSKHRY